MKNTFLRKSLILKIFAILFLITAFFTPFAPALNVKRGDTYRPYGNLYAFVFAGTIKSENVTYNAFNIAILAFISILIFYLSFIILVTTIFLNKVEQKKIKFWLTISSVLLTFIGSICLLYSHKNLANTLANTFLNQHNDTYSKVVYQDSYMHAGVWLTAIAGLISSINLFISIVFEKIGNDRILYGEPAKPKLSKRQRNIKILKKIGLVTFILVFILVTVLNAFSGLEERNVVVIYVCIATVSIIYLAIIITFIVGVIKKRIPKK